MTGLTILGSPQAFALGLVVSLPLLPKHGRGREGSQVWPVSLYLGPPLRPLRPRSPPCEMGLTGGARWGSDHFAKACRPMCSSHSESDTHFLVRHLRLGVLGGPFLF